MAKKNKSPAFAPMPAEPTTKAADDKEDKYQIEDDARTLMRAEEIKQKPDRHGKAVKHLQGQKQAINSIEGLRAHANDMAKTRRMSMKGDS